MSPWSDNIRHRRRGAILMIVLVMIFLASVLVVKVVEELTMQIRAKTAQVSRDELRYTGLSALETTLAVISEISEIDGSLNGPAQGWNDPLAYASSLQWPEGVEIEVTVTDETGKFPLSEVSTTQLSAFFDTLDINYDDAETLSDSLLDWMDEDDDARLNGAEASFYENEDPPLTPANAPLNSWEALRYIKGFRDLFFDETGAPNALYDRFTRSFSLHTTTDPNMNTANADVLETLGEQYGFDADYLADHRSGRDRVVGTYDDESYASADDLTTAGIAIGEAPVSYVCEVLKVEVRVRYGEKAYLLTALVDTGEGEEEDDDDNGSSGGNGSGGDTPATGEQGGSSGGSATVTESTSNYPYTILKLVESMEVD
jgi:general secretion pathway protein K